MANTIKLYKPLSELSVYLSDTQRFTPPHWVSEGAVSLLVAVLSTVIVCSCGKDDIPSSLSTETSFLQAKLGQLVPNSRWQLTKALYTVGDVEINAAWSNSDPCDLCTVIAHVVSCSGRRLGCTDLILPSGIANQTRVPCPRSSAIPISPLNNPSALSLRAIITGRPSYQRECG